MPKNLAEKILQMHCQETLEKPGQIVQCQVSGVLANDITAPLAIKSFEAMGATRVFDQDRIYLVCDHFTPNKDIDSAEQVKTVREFAQKMGITHYFEGGACGVEHALLPESGLLGPGDVIVGADSHTCTYGALASFATGLGSTDIAAAMALGRTWFKVPESIKVELRGELPPHIEGKDLVLALIGQIGVDGALYKALEFSGPVLSSLGLEERMTMANMAIEAGAKVGLFPADQNTLDYCAQTGRQSDQMLQPDPGARYADRIVLDVSRLKSQVACPHLPENVRPAEELGQISLDQVVIGSCTNGRISDLRKAAAILKGHQVAPGLRLIVLPATPKVYSQALEEGLLSIFLKTGAVIGPPTCGPCLGGHMGILASGETCLATTNRNFKGRMGSLDSAVYLAGPAVAAASALTGRITSPETI